MWPPVWESIYQSRAWGQYPGEDAVRFVKSLTPKSRILEVGCGSGANLWLMAREGHNAFGIDGSETAIKLAKDKLDRECPGWRGFLQAGDFCELPFRDAYFDAALDIASICCNSAEDTKRAYAELARVTKQGGTLLSRCFATGCDPIDGAGPIRLTDESETEALCQGWRIERIEHDSRTERGKTIKHLLIYGTKP